MFPSYEEKGENHGKRSFMSQNTETKNTKTPLKPTREAQRKEQDDHPTTRANDPVPNLEGISIIRRSK